MLVLNVRGRGVQENLTATFLPRIWLSFNVSALSLCRFHRISDVGFGGKGGGGRQLRVHAQKGSDAFLLACSQVQGLGPTVSCVGHWE